MHWVWQSPFQVSMIIALGVGLSHVTKATWNQSFLSLLPDAQEDRIERITCRFIKEKWEKLQEGRVWGGKIRSSNMLSCLVAFRVFDRPWGNPWDWLSLNALPTALNEPWVVSTQLEWPHLICSVRGMVTDHDHFHPHSPNLFDPFISSWSSHFPFLVSGYMTVTWPSTVLPTES